MSEPISDLGRTMGVRLVQVSEQERRSRETVSFDDIMGISRVPPEIEDYAHLGSIEPVSMPPESLHQLVKARNKRVASLVREYAKIVGGYRFRIFRSDETDLGIEQFRKRCVFPPLEESMYRASMFRLPHTQAMNQKYGIGSLGNEENHYGNFDTSSIVGASLIPELDVYLDNFANNAPQNASRSTPTNPEFTRDILGWKNYFKTLDPYLTSFFFQPITAYVPLEAFKRHAYIIGGSGSGKSELIKHIVHHIITAKSAKDFGAVIIDPHGDLAEEIARFKPCFKNKRIVFFDPENSKYHTPSMDIFNPPDLEESTIDIMAGNLADAFEEIIADTNITSQMRTLLIPCISVLLRREGSSLSDLQRFMVDEENTDLVDLGARSPNSGQADFFKKKFNTKSYATTKSSIYTRLQTLLNSTIFRRIINPKWSFDLETEINSGSIVIFSLAKSSVGNDVSGALGRLVVAQIKNIGFRRQRVLKAKRVPTFVFIDECQNYIGESIEIALTELRKYGIHMILANQVLGQNMSSQLEKIILANTAVKFAGYNGEASHIKMAKEMSVSVDELKSLTTGRFCCKVSDPKQATHPFIMKIPSNLVGNKGGMSPENWYEQKKEGWRFCIANSELDTAMKSSKAETKNDNPVLPDFVDEPGQDSSKPKFDL